MKKTRITALILAIAMTLCALTGCSLFKPTAVSLTKKTVENLGKVQSVKADTNVDYEGAVTIAQLGTDMDIKLSGDFDTEAVIGTGTSHVDGSVSTTLPIFGDISIPVESYQQIVDGGAVSYTNVFDTGWVKTESKEEDSKTSDFNLDPKAIFAILQKIVSGMDEESLDVIAKVYELVVQAGVYRAESIKVAEAAKVIENSQRDINIAFMNELSIMFNKMGIDTKAVLEAASTKWNFLKFYPGLVGGHCIGVDPYYLTYKAEMIGYHSQIILAGRRINDNMGKYVAQSTVKKLIACDKAVRNARVAILGFTFKENCPDTRNTKIIDIVNELREYGIQPVITDPLADADEAKRLYGVEFSDMSAVHDMDAVILSVAHDSFKTLTMEDIDGFFGRGKKVLIDIKGMFDRKLFESAGYVYWRL